MVNNAGLGAATSIEEATVEQARRIFDTNVHGPLRIVNAAVPLMRAQGSGGVVQVSSLNGRLVPPLGGLYAASKFALEALTMQSRGTCLPTARCSCSSCLAA